MVARTYDKLGGIGGVQANHETPYSLRGVDRDRFQNFVFQCDPDYPFTGVILVQISQDDPSKLTRDAQGRLRPDSSSFTWSTAAKMAFAGERDDIFLELEIEAAHVRARCVEYDANASVSSNAGATVGGTGAQEFTIDGTSVSVASGDTLSDVLSAITSAAVPDISASIDPELQTLLITKTDGTTVTLAEVTGTPLEDIGVLRQSDGGSFTANPNGRISQIKTMR